MISKLRNAHVDQFQQSQLQKLEANVHTKLDLFSWPTASKCINKRHAGNLDGVSCFEERAIPATLFPKDHFSCNCPTMHKQRLRIGISYWPLHTRNPWLPIRKRDHLESNTWHQRFLKRGRAFEEKANEGKER